MQDVLNEKLTLVSINISTFSGYRRATRDHIAALGGSLPASAAITEGSIKVFPGDGTKALQTVRRGVFRKLQAKGVKALGSQQSTTSTWLSSQFTRTRSGATTRK